MAKPLYFLGAGISLLCALAILWQSGLPRGYEFILRFDDDEIISAPVIGGRLPPIQATSLDGASVALEGSLGYPLIVNFWATWCEPCLAEMPLLQSLYEDGIPVLGINAGMEEPAFVAEWAGHYGIIFPIVMDPDPRSLEAAYRVRGLPTTFFIDEDGFIRHIEQGALTPNSLQEGLAAIGVE